MNLIKYLKKKKTTTVFHFYIKIFIKPDQTKRIHSHIQFFFVIGIMAEICENLSQENLNGGAAPPASLQLSNTGGCFDFCFYSSK